MKFLFLVFWSSLSFAGSSCYEACKMSSLPYMECLERTCPSVSQNWRIICYADTAQIFSLSIDVKERLPTSFFSTSQYKVEGITLNGPRMQGYEFKEIMTESKISTRTHTGYKYGLKIANYGTITLTDIDYSHLPDHFPIGFYGSLKLDHQQNEVALSCIKN